MGNQVALLRAINLGKNARVSMADLRALGAELGFDDVATLLQSGNVVYRTSSSSARAEAAWEQGLRDRIGLTTDVIVRTRADMQKIIESNPFPAEARKDPARLLVMMCKRAPGSALHITGAKDEKVRAVGKDIYIVYPGGVGASRLKLSAKGTARNWNTVLRIARALQ
ncbi:MAG: DUF1697 domain-containing protein [Actinomycetota bacterium]